MTPEPVQWATTLNNRPLLHLGKINIEWCRRRATKLLQSDYQLANVARFPALCLLVTYPRHGQHVMTRSEHYHAPHDYAHVPVCGMCLLHYVFRNRFRENPTHTQRSFLRSEPTPDPRVVFSISPLISPLCPIVRPDLSRHGEKGWKNAEDCRSRGEER